MLNQKPIKEKLYKRRTLVFIKKRIHVNLFNFSLLYLFPIFYRSAKIKVHFSDPVKSLLDEYDDYGNYIGDDPNLMDSDDESETDNEN